MIGRVESLAFGGQGIVRHEGLVVFVPFTAPGDTIRFCIVKQKKTFAEGQLLELLEAGPERCVPRCPYFGVCGGCQLQHLNYEEQLRQKRRFVFDALQRVGKLKGLDMLTITGASDQWAYRRHIRLSLRATSTGYEAGYVRDDLLGIVPVSECPIFVALGHPLLPVLQDLLAELTPIPGEAGSSLSVIHISPDRFILTFEFPSRLPSHCEARVSAWMLKHANMVVGVTLKDQTGSRTYGDCHGEFTVQTLKIRFSPNAFVQCHPEQSANVYREIVRLSKECHSRVVLDLYCGIGVTSLLLAKEGCSVTGVEGNPEAIRLAKENAKVNAVPDVQFLNASVQNVLKGLIARLGPDLVVMNPPRTGLDPKTRDQILVNPVKCLIYVSCMPATLARDLAAFQDHGYQLKSCRVFDMFPQTTHVETVVLMERP